MADLSAEIDEHLQAAINVVLATGGSPLEAWEVVNINLSHLIEDVVLA